MLLLSRCCVLAVVVLVVVVVTPRATPQEADKLPTLEQDKQALMGDWKMVVVQNGDSTLTKLRFTDRYVRLFILYQSATSFDVGNTQFEYQFVEKDGQRLVVLFGADRNQTPGTVTYKLEGDKLRLAGVGKALNNRKYDLTGEWTRTKEKK